MKLEKAALVTDVDFWRYGSGHRSRITSLVSYLSRTTELTVVLLECPPARNLEKRHPGCRFVFLERPVANPQEGYVQALATLLRTRNIGVCIIEYIHLSYLLEGIPVTTRTLLDTHDIVSEREDDFIRFGCLTPQGRTMTKEREIEIFRRYDKVMLIQAADYEQVAGLIGREKALLVPHAVRTTPRPVRRQVQTIGFVGSTYPPNVNGIEWFMAHVWPAVAAEGVSLHLYGNVAGRVGDHPGVVKRGFVPRLETAYGEIDIAINPVQFGAGLKIKNVEALGNGLPLVMDPHGSKGLEAGVGSAFLVAGTAEAFAAQLTALAGSFALRTRLSQAALQLAEDYFSPRVCYRPLLEAIYQAEAAF